MSQPDVLQEAAQLTEDLAFAAPEMYAMHIERRFSEALDAAPPAPHWPSPTPERVEELARAIEVVALVDRDRVLAGDYRADTYAEHASRLLAALSGVTEPIPAQPSANEVPITAKLAECVCDHPESVHLPGCHALTGNHVYEVWCDCRSFRALSEHRPPGAEQPR